MVPIFFDCKEIRMGAPYSCCRVSFQSDVAFDLPERNWQDLWSHSDDGRYIALVAWDTPNNDPGFRIHVIDTSTNSVTEHQRNSGCCQTLRWVNNHFEWTAFPGSRGSVTPVGNP